MQIQEQVRLAPYTTLGIGGPAQYFCAVRTKDELLDAVAFARAKGLRMSVLGGGSNLLVADAGFDGLVVHLLLDAETVVTREDDAVFYDVAAGTGWDEFVRQTCAQGDGGVECLAGIPGLVGGTPVQNVGAYGQEVAQTIDRVTVLDLESLMFRQMSREECGFSYRTSLFNSTHRGRYIVTSVRFRLKPGAKANLSYADLQRHFAGREPGLSEVYEAVRAIRRSKGMLLVEGDPDCRSAGSFFKNPIVPISVLATVAGDLGLAQTQIPNWPVAPDKPRGQGTTKLPAAWLLDQAGFHKGFAFGEAGISTRHTLALVNRTGAATCADIVRLRDRIVDEVRTRFGVELEQEPVYLSSLRR